MLLLQYGVIPLQSILNVVRAVAGPQLRLWLYTGCFDARRFAGLVQDVSQVLGCLVVLHAVLIWP